ncbi:MAG: hypothetical protein FJ298_14995 [Planctomycetes bacterium]|nr:hypothetical protein [Planctomycetota bacterium]
MRSHPATGWFVALVVVALALLGMLGADDSVRATRRARLWRPQGAGFVLRVPPGWSDWSESRRDGAQALLRDASDPLAGALGYRVEPDFHAIDDPQRIEDFAREMLGAEGRTVEFLECTEVDGCPAVRIEWSADASGRDVQRGFELVLDRGMAIVVLEARSRESCWPEVRGELSAMLASVALERR